MVIFAIFLRATRWLRSYRTYFFIGICILLIQVYLAARFLPINKNSEEVKESQFYNVVDVEENEGGQGGNSARKSRSEGLSIDDEDSHLGVVKSKKYKNATTVAQLRLEELDFVPPCEINTKEAVSAIHRAKTQRCKQIISNITCLSLANKLYPTKLTGSCPSNGFVEGKDMGCYRDEKNFRLLSGYFGVNKKNNSPQFCIKLCLQSGYSYAGVQYSEECFCGNDEPPSTSKIPDSSCNMKCPGDNHATCGGYFTINIFQTGIKKFVPQVAKTEVDENAKRVKIVFLLTLNGRAVRQVRRLIKNLYHIDHFYYIHVDVRQDYLFRELLRLEKIFPNIKLTRKRFATIWGGASLLRMLRSCMHELLQLPWQWDFVLNLSESDFPVKTVTQLTNFLTANKGRNFVKSHGREVQRFIQKQGLDKTFVECDTRMWRVGDRQLPMGIQIDGGSDWVALSRDFVQYVANPMPDSLVRGLLRIFNLTLLPAESFFHTVLRNSYFCNTYVDNNLHVTNWKRKLGCKCQYKHIVDWCGCSPNDFRPEDWTKIQSTQSRQLYFARKFEPIINQAVILQLELWLYNLDKPNREVENLHSYWQNIYHHKDLGTNLDDGLLTLAYSIMRRITKRYSNESCRFNTGSIYKITYFNSRDKHKYTLFYFNISDTVNMEVAVRPKRHLYHLTSIHLSKYVDKFYVSNDYDQKEQTSRNFLQILSPYSDLVLIYNFTGFKTSHSFNATCLWIDPGGQLQEVSNLSIDETSLIGHIKPSVKQPLLPGNWTVKLIHKNAAILQTHFLITPLEFFSGIPLTESQVGFFHRGSLHAKDFGNTYDAFLPNEVERNILDGISESNAKRQGGDLQEWIDSLSNKFYSIEKDCIHFKNVQQLNICGKMFGSCSLTSWSSLAPDPKSAINKIINSTTGMFDIW